MTPRIEITKWHRRASLELVPLQDLRQRVKAAAGLPGRLKVSVVTGDVRQMHRLSENASATFDDFETQSLVPMPT
jgi:hypothetical protein